MPAGQSATTGNRIFPPPLLRTWPFGIRLILAGVTPIVFGLICGAVLRTSGAAFLALQGIGTAGGYWAGLEHAAVRAGAARGVTGGLLFGTSILVGHAITGGSDHGLLPHPELLQRMRILLSEGSSGQTSRQVITQLASGGHEVHVVSPDPLCLGRFTRHVRRVQDKIAARATLAELALPQPHTAIARSIDELLNAGPLPLYIKTPIGTATVGVRHVSDRAELQLTARQLDEQDAFADGGLLMQQPVMGPLVMVQAVFANGRLLAWHANVRARLGANGGASSKRSVVLPDIHDHLVRLGAALRWHGALSLDAVITPDGPCYIDVNPRLVEPGNAWRAGVDLVDVLLHVTLGKPIDPVAPGRPDVLTHQLLNAVLGAGQQLGSRRAVLAEVVAAARSRGPYRGSREELTPIRGDLAAAIPSQRPSPRSWPRPNYGPPSPAPPSPTTPSHPRHGGPSANPRAQATDRRTGAATDSPYPRAAGRRTTSEA